MLYHRDIGFPSTLELRWEYTFDLKYGKHAQEAAKKERYGEIRLPQAISFPKNSIIEIETQDSIKIDKMVIRVSYALNNKLDLCLVIIPEKGFVKTVWMNEANDKHTTLDKSKYEKVF